MNLCENTAGNIQESSLRTRKVDVYITHDQYHTMTVHSVYIYIHISLYSLCYHIVASPELDYLPSSVIHSPHLTGKGNFEKFQVLKNSQTFQECERSFKT